MHTQTLFILTSILTIISAITIQIQIPPSSLLPNPNTLPSSTHATLTSGTAPPIHASLRANNTIILTDIQTTGSHLLDIYSRDYVFAPYRIDIVDSKIVFAAETYRGIQWTDHGHPLVSSEGTVSLVVSAKIVSQRSFYEERQGFNVLNLLKNPMILLAVVALGITFGMPKLMENMDPEMKAEYEEMQKKGGVSGLTRAMAGAGGAGGGGQQGGTGMEGFDLAGFLAGRQSGQGGFGGMAAGGRGTGSDKAAAAGGDAGGIRERKR